MTVIDLKGNPFFLDEEGIKWVNRTIKDMSIEEKVGQLFCPIGYSSDENYLYHEFIDRKVGGLLFRDDKSEIMRETYTFLQKNSKIPMFLAGNLEAGGNGLLVDGTFFGKALQVAATDDINMAYELGNISCKEASAVGGNFSFAPVVDIDYNFRNPITNVRTYGSDPKKVVEFGKQYIKAATKHDFVTSVKHFPGDGVDERDQHILTSVNSMGVEEWNDTFGKVYQELIDFGTKSVMVGHIALPSYEKLFDNKEKRHILPASLSKNILNELLRKKMKFNGLIITDATPMVGFCAAMKRSEAVPLSIENGCDMFLFNKDLSEDYEYMLDGLKNGILSHKRLTEAVTRILATKASINLHTKAMKGNLIPKKSEMSVIGSKEHISLAYECADKGITLVKDTQEILPINNRTYKNVLLQILGDSPSDERVFNKFSEYLKAEGFNVIPYVKETFRRDGSLNVDSVGEFKEKYDLVIYIGNIENASNKTTNRINWYTFFGLGNNIPWFVEEVPTLFISVANPYHLFDVPMVKSYINCYSNSDIVIETCINKIMGLSEFKGINPVDPFCGREELEY